MKKLLIFFVFYSFIGFLQAQEVTIRLDSCLKLAEQSVPISQNYSSLQTQYEYKVKSLKTNWYPSLTLNGQATWQNEVTTLNVDLPFLTEPLMSLSKDQYRISLDVKQTIWDGGTTRNMRKTEQALFTAETVRNNKDIFSFKEQIADVYFAIMKLQRQVEVLTVKKWQLLQKIEDLNHAAEYGVVLPDVLDVLQSEQLSLEQKIIEVQYEENALIKLLSDYLHINISEFAVFLLPTPEVNPDVKSVRPEVEYFEAVKTQLSSSEKILKTAMMPRIYAFSQLGYGRPGLNMLSDDFAPFVIVGAKLVWTPFDWGKNKNDRQVVKVQQQLVENNIQQFEYNQQALLSAQYQRIVKAEKLIEKDEEIILLKKRITIATAAKLNQGTVTASEYLIALDEEQAAQLNYELHFIMLAEAKVKYNMLKGILYE